MIKELIATVAIVGSLLYPTNDQVKLSTVTFEGGVDGTSIALLIAKMEMGDNVTLHVNSPGGSATAFKNFVLYMRYNNKTFNTYTSRSAASAGALLWTMGKVRAIEPDAVILYHGAHLGSYSLTEDTVCKASTFMATDRGQELFAYVLAEGVTKAIKDKKLVWSDIKKLQTTVTIAQMDGIAGVEQVLDTVCGSLKTSNDMQVKVIMDNTGLSEEYVRTILLGDMKKDMRFTGQQLFDIGIAHKLGR